MKKQKVGRGRSQVPGGPCPGSVGPTELARAWVTGACSRPRLNGACGASGPDNLFVIRVINKQVACQHGDWHERLRR